MIAPEAYTLCDDLMRLQHLEKDDPRCIGMAYSVQAWLTKGWNADVIRQTVETDLANLSRVERRVLRGFGVRIGAFCLWLPGQTAPDARPIAWAFAAQADRDWRPAGAGPWPTPTPAPPARALGLRGLFAAGPLVVAAPALERLSEEIRREAVRAK